MTDVTLLQKKVARGQDAEAILQAPLFKEVGESCRNQWFKDFSGDDEEKAAAARQEVRAFEKFLTKLVKIHKEGIAAQKQIREIQRRSEEGLSQDSNDMQGIA